MLKNAATYMLGSVLSQAMLLAAIPVLSRLYSPADFGVFGMFTAMLSVVGAAACLRYELAIPLPKGNKRAASVAAAGGVSLLFSIVATLLAVILFRQNIAQWLDAPSLVGLLWLLPLSVAGYGLFELLNYWSTRNGRFISISGANVLRAAGAVSTQIGAAAAMGGGAGLIIGQLVGQWLANAALLVQLFRKDRAVLADGFFNRKRMLALALRYQTFPRHGAPQALLNAASQSVPALMLGWFFSPVVVGLYAMAHRVVSAPMTLISQALRQAMLPQLSRARINGQSLLPIVRKYTFGLALIGLPVPIVLILSGEQLFSFVLGGEWGAAGIYAAWLAPWLWMNMINPPSTIALTVLEKQRIQLIVELLLTALRVISIVAGGLLGSVKLAIILFSGSGVVVNVMIISIAMISARKNK